MRVLLILLACLLAADQAVAERLRTGWNGTAGFSHYFPLTSEERTRLMALQKAQRTAGAAALHSDARASDVFVPQPGKAGGGPPPICGWAGCRLGTQVQQSHHDVCGWAGCRAGFYAAPSFADGGFRDRCGWAGCR